MKQRCLSHEIVWWSALIEPGTSRRSYLDPDAYQTLRRWCVKTPIEVGGLLGGFGNHIMFVTKIPNISDKPAGTVQWNFNDVRKSRRDVREFGLKVIGQWHSHPYGWDASPSISDIDMHSSYELIWCCTHNYPRLWLLRGTPEEIYKNEHKLYLTKALT